MPRLFLLLTVTASSADSPGTQAKPASQPAPVSHHTDFKVLIWYRESRPLETFKYQIYDVRKGEYTPAVDAWVQLMRTKYTAYYVAIRDVDLAREHGDTDQLKVGAVVKRELMVAAALEGVVVGNGLPRPQWPAIAPGRGLPAAPGMIDRRSSPGSGSVSPPYLNPPAPTFPVPVPYPRPHP